MESTFRIADDDVFHRLRRMLVERGVRDRHGKEPGAEPSSCCASCIVRQARTDGRLQIETLAAEPACAFCAAVLSPEARECRHCGHPRRDVTRLRATFRRGAGWYPVATADETLRRLVAEIVEGLGDNARVQAVDDTPPAERARRRSEAAREAAGAQIGDYSL